MKPDGRKGLTLVIAMSIAGVVMLATVALANRQQNPPQLFFGHWVVAKAAARPSEKGISNESGPYYIGLELEVSRNVLKWMSHHDHTVTTPLCLNPTFARETGSANEHGTVFVVDCGRGDWGFPHMANFKEIGPNRIEMTWFGGLSFELVRKP